ncbi:PepSY-associated transmembrane protein [Balneicella halophila]|uniref:PepSY-associated transmembrane protein n=1 Tax=Balneicella halophila TaxID=1537566 RepID=A0A7L4UT25_BALHA|nr:PepSY domain-containing protein [Balneicella halophila]PVX52194.1 PepSY-associated transmembrane protein [Balneicella halophila]
MIKLLRKYHKWIGLISILFVLHFAISGILLNHRKAISGIDVSRNLLPKSYHFENWNNGAVIGTLKINADSILMYGNSGIWLTDSLCSKVEPYHTGISKGIDNRSFRAVKKLGDNAVFGVSTYELYRLDITTNSWENQTSKLDVEGERLSNLALKGDTLFVVSRSHVFRSVPPYDTFEKIQLLPPSDYSPKVSLFKMIWILHSGEAYGLFGRLLVDALGLIIIIITLLGLALTLFRIPIRKRIKKKRDAERLKDAWKFSLKWHNKLGFGLFYLLLFVVVTGTFLRPPLLIPIVRAKVNPIPFSTLDSDNPWNEKLRVLRYNEHTDSWLLYSSDGFYQFPDFNTTPKPLANKPPISVMGVTVLEPQSEEVWLVGSFSGLYLWNKKTGASYDAFTKELYVPEKTFGPPVLSDPISGYSDDFSMGEVAFNYDKGAVGLSQQSFVEMPAIVKAAPMSLWHFALELHVGRMYSPFLGALSPFFVFFSGLLFFFILFSGYKVYKKRHKKRKKKRVR